MSKKLLLLCGFAVVLGLGAGQIASGQDAGQPVASTVTASLETTEAPPASTQAPSAVTTAADDTSAPMGSNLTTERLPASTQATEILPASEQESGAITTATDDTSVSIPPVGATMGTASQPEIEAAPAGELSPYEEEDIGIMEAAKAAAGEPSAKPGQSVAVAEIDATATNEMIKIGVEKAPVEGAAVAPAAANPDLLSISLDNVSIQEVVRLFTRVSGANIVAGTNLQGTVTVSLKDVEWEPALRVILDSVGLTLVEKKAGIYSIISLSDLAGEPLSADTIFLKYTTATNVLPVVKGMLISSNASVSIVASANALIIKETAQNINTIRQSINSIDKPRPQVFIEAKFVELNDQAIKDIGIAWTTLGGDGRTPGGWNLKAGSLEWSREENRKWNDSRETRQEQYDHRNQSDVYSEDYDMDGKLVDGGQSIDDSIVRGFNVDQTIVDSFDKTVSDIRTAVLSASEFNIMLSALKQNSGVSVVSNPKVLVASGETAYILVGTQEPQVKSEYNADQKMTTYTLDRYIDVGIKVRVTPVVNTMTNISVRIMPEISDVLEYIKPGGDAQFPRLSTRQVVTDFNLESGKTVAIGGLTKTTDKDQEKKIPILGDIPLIGKYLFRHTFTRKEQDEIIIFVTVAQAKAESLTETRGIPKGGRLIYQYLNKNADQVIVDPDDPGAPVAR